MKETNHDIRIKLNAEFIENLSYTEEKIIMRYFYFILTEIKKNSKTLGSVQKAREIANKKYGKGWREGLRGKSIYKKNPFGKMSYF